MNSQKAMIDQHGNEIDELKRVIVRKEEIIDELKGVIVIQEATIDELKETEEKIIQEMDTMRTLLEDLAIQVFLNKDKISQDTLNISNNQAEIHKNAVDVYENLVEISNNDEIIGNYNIGIRTNHD